MRNVTASANLFRMACVPVVWSGHFIACYVAVSLACKFDAQSVSLPILLVTVAALALLAWIAALSHIGRRLAQGERGSTATSRFLALATLMLCALSALAVLWIAFPAAVLPPCVA